jgi:hypothetical protein
MNKLLFWLFLASQGAKVIKIIELNGTSAIFFQVPEVRPGLSPKVHLRRASEQKRQKHITRQVTVS